jgi:hypothetical protein
MMDEPFLIARKLCRHAYFGKVPAGALAVPRRAH